MKRDQNLSYTPKEVVVTNGGKQALAAAFACLLNRGDEVIIPAPYWTSYPDMAALVGGVPVIVNTKPEDGYLLKPAALKAAITAKTKAIVLNSPSNPTGACYSEADLKALKEAILALPNRTNITVITDEVYEYITYDGFKHVSFAQVAPELRDQIVIVNAFSKAYSMTGWRVGYAVGPAPIIAAMGTHQSQFTSNVCSIAQCAAARAYDDHGAFPKSMAAEFAKRVEIVCDAVAHMPGVSLAAKPRGAFYAFLRVEGLRGKKSGKFEIKSGTDFTNYLLENYNVATVQGDAFGDPNAVRLSFALAENRLREGLARMTEAVRALK
jgi:aspartate aminotransferase